MALQRRVERAKWFAVRHFEQLLVSLLFASMVGIHWAIDYKVAFLSFYYLPVIVAGFHIGRRGATYAAVLVVALVVFFQAAVGLDGTAGLNGVVLLTLVPWAGFLILTAYVVGGLADQRRERHDDLKRAYLTLLELLTLNLEERDGQVRGHSHRVAARAISLGKALAMRPDQVDTLRVAALLHEVGPDDPRLTALFERIPGSSDAPAVAAALRSAFALITEYSRYFELVGGDWPVDHLRISMAAKVLAVSDTFETLRHPTETRAPLSVWAALEEIERGAGTTFATPVVRALRKSVTPRRSRRIRTIAAV
ncbi:MAG TPA: hypothetical protein VMH39_07375 [Gemmatimonadaceae bacterium]|nr:hypothetical protein [Gemmatimonadaceae bacterium]